MVQHGYWYLYGVLQKIDNDSLLLYLSLFLLSSLLYRYQENARLLTGQPMIPPNQQAQRNLAQRARTRAINIDRFSRVFFPVLFAILNCTYWIMFAEFL